MRIAVVSVILCGLASATPAYSDDGHAVAAALAKVIERRDVAAFQRMLDLAVSLNGLRFTTPACDRFTEDYSRLAYAFADDFLTCIAALHPRVIAGRAALSYEPGGEIALDVNNGFIRGFYGYAKRRPDAPRSGLAGPARPPGPPGPPDAPIPTVQPAALEALRVAGDKAIAPDAISAADLARGLGLPLGAGVPHLSAFDRVLDCNQRPVTHRALVQHRDLAESLKGAR